MSISQQSEFSVTPYMEGYRVGMNSGRASERAQIVAYILQDVQNVSGIGRPIEFVLADAIENGVHKSN